MKNVQRLKSTALAAVLLVSAVSAQAETLLEEGFGSVASLAGNGWVLTNNSLPAGPVAGWFQGDQQIFPAQSGAAESYVAANFELATAGGVINTWLITPEFSTETPVQISFYARADIFEDYFDNISWGVSDGSSGIGSFDLTNPITLSGTWTQYTMDVAAQGAGTVGRFAIAYAGAADASNYIGIDTLTVNAVPEPATWLMLGAGVLGLAARRRAAFQR